MRITVGTVLDTPNDGRWTVDAILDVWVLSSLVLLRPEGRYRAWNHQRCLTQRELLYGILNNYFSRVST